MHACIIIIIIIIIIISFSLLCRHLSRFLFVWCSALPLALYPLVGPWGTVPTSTILSFFFLGIEDIGTHTHARTHIRRKRERAVSCAAS